MKTSMAYGVWAFATILALLLIVNTEPSSKPSMHPSSLPVSQSSTQSSTSPASQPSSQPARELALDLGSNVTMRLALIPAGTFMMGSPNGERWHNSNEGPQHEVMIETPFYMGVTHVTVEQFAAFVKDSNYRTTAELDGWSNGVEIRNGECANKQIPGCSWDKPGFEQRSDCPVVQINWNDATAFCRWLSKKSGRVIMLPTEAQWEYACRAGTKTAYPWGSDPNGGNGWANCADQSLKRLLPDSLVATTAFEWDDGYVFTSPVGKFKPNAFGLYDMIGNVRQWCLDANDIPLRGSSEYPEGSLMVTNCVLRGSSWSGDSMDSRCAVRTFALSNFRNSKIGFRVVAAPELMPMPEKKELKIFATPILPAMSMSESTLDLGNNIIMQLALIGAGKFMMGSSTGEANCNENEGPLREVTLNKSFYMGIAEVTQVQYDYVMGDNPSRFKGAQSPVENVSWNDAVEFCKKLSERTGRKVRLPTEAEWEYACRAGNQTAISFDGNDASLGKFSWYEGNSKSSTQMVGQKLPNAWGLYDMHGNVWEWCSDYFADSYANAKNEEPQGPASGTQRVLRGGGWDSAARDCRSATRRSGRADECTDNRGFRVVVERY